MGMEKSKQKWLVEYVVIQCCSDRMCDVGCEQVPTNMLYAKMIPLSWYPILEESKDPKNTDLRNFQRGAFCCLNWEAFKDERKLIKKKHWIPGPAPHDSHFQHNPPWIWWFVLTKCAADKNCGPRFDKGWMKRGTYYTVLQNYVQKAIQNLARMLYRWDTKPLPGCQWKVKVNKNYRLNMQWSEWQLEWWEDFFASQPRWTRLLLPRR